LISNCRYLLAISLPILTVNVLDIKLTVNVLDVVLTVNVLDVTLTVNVLDVTLTVNVLDVEIVDISLPYRYIQHSLSLGLYDV
jgi:hypothetical protein